VNSKPVFIAAFILGAFAILGVGLVSATYEGTKDRIAFNERQSLLRKLHALVPADSVDNDMVSDRIEVHDANLLGADTTYVYRGRKGEDPVALVLTPVVPDGYSGPIKLLVAVRKDGTLGGVRVVSHKETPGLGDKIEEEKSDWVLGFHDKSLSNPPLDQWAVKRDGGYFDQFTGATITPRSIVKAVKKTLLYVQAHNDELFKHIEPKVAAAEKTGEKS
jgi:electron transport complex protein RnfG